jgi:hypothetical protein
MDPDGLARWDPRAMPVVTALDDPAAALPARFRGYLGPERTVDLRGDGSTGAPVLVVLPDLHPARRGTRHAARTDVVSRERADPPPGSQAMPLR